MSDPKNDMQKTIQAACHALDEELRMAHNKFELPDREQVLDELYKAMKTAGLRFTDYFEIRVRTTESI